MSQRINALFQEAGRDLRLFNSSLASRTGLRERRLRTTAPGKRRSRNERDPTGRRWLSSLDLCCRVALVDERRSLHRCPRNTHRVAQPPRGVRGGVRPTHVLGDDAVVLQTELSLLTTLAWSLRHDSLGRSKRRRTNLKTNPHGSVLLPGRMHGNLCMMAGGGA